MQSTIDGMTSLFDVAAALGGWNAPSGSSKALAPPETALGILDDALQSLYGARPAALAPSRSVNDLDDRLEQLMRRERAKASSSSDVKALTAMDAKAEGQRDGLDADVKARNALRELGEELELLRMGYSSNSNNSREPKADAEQVAALLTRKYAVERLDALPGTPFVLLARRKAQLKIDQLCLALAQKHQQPSPAVNTAKATSSTPSPNNSIGADDEWLRRVEAMLALPPDKRAALRRLVALPEAQRRRLPAAQRELAVFAGRLDALLALPMVQRWRLPPEHQRVLNALQQQMYQQA